MGDWRNSGNVWVHMTLVLNVQTEEEGFEHQTVYMPKVQDPETVMESQFFAMHHSLQCCHGL